MNIASVIGARPEFVQAALLSKVIGQSHQEILIHTGQHYDFRMSDLFFRDLQIRSPEFNLGVGSGGHATQTAEMLVRLETVYLDQKPDLVVVRGDTNSTLAGALAAAKLHLPVVHVEAGMRSFNRKMPEEINRVLTDHLSDLLLCPTKTAVANLQREGISNRVRLVGDVMYDTIMRYLPFALTTSNILRELGYPSKTYFLTTIHRAENTDSRDRLQNILAALDSLSHPVVMPVHPRTQKAIANLDMYPTRIRFVEPVGYLDMLMLMQNARKVFTDSGGVQREAFFLGIPCVTLRNETEWPETVNEGWNILVGSDRERIVQAAEEFWPLEGKPTGRFGDGHACEKILQALEEFSA